MPSAHHLLNKWRTPSLAREPKCFSINICKLSMSKDPVGGNSLRACSTSDMVISSAKRSSLCSLWIELSEFSLFTYSYDRRQTFEWKDVYLRKTFGIRRQFLTPCMQVDPRKCGPDHNYQCSFYITCCRSSRSLNFFCNQILVINFASNLELPGQAKFWSVL